MNSQPETGTAVRHGGLTTAHMRTGPARAGAAHRSIELRASDDQ